MVNFLLHIFASFLIFKVKMSHQEKKKNYFIKSVKNAPDFLCKAVLLVTKDQNIAWIYKSFS